MECEPVDWVANDAVVAIVQMGLKELVLLGFVVIVQKDWRAMSAVVTVETPKMDLEEEEMLYPVANQILI